MVRFSENLPEKFRTNEHTYNREELDDGRTIFRKDGKFTQENAFTSAYFFARVEVALPDEDGEPVFTELGVDEASELGTIANNPQEGGTVTVEGKEYTHQEIADIFDVTDERQDDPIKY